MEVKREVNDWEDTLILEILVVVLVGYELVKYDDFEG